MTTLVIVLIDNRGFANIGSLSETVGSQRFGTQYRSRCRWPSTLRRLEGLPVRRHARARRGGHPLLHPGQGHHDPLARPAGLRAPPCEPPSGLPDLPPILAALEELGTELFTVVEQDMYPCDFSKPKPIAERTFRYLNANGLGGTA